MFYSSRGLTLENQMKQYEEDKDIEFQTNDDVYELILIDSEDDSNIFMLSFHTFHDCELDSLRLGGIIKENGQQYEAKE
jgi:hypothetical protein